MTSALTRLIVSILVVSAAFLAYGFWYNAIANKSDEVATLISHLADQTAIENRALTLRSTLGDIADVETVVNSHFVSSGEVVAFLEDLEHRGATVGSTVTVGSVSPTGDAKHPALQVSLRASGSFNEVMNTIGAIEYAPYTISVSSLSLSLDTSDPEAKKRIWNAGMNLTVGSLPSATTTPTKGAATSTTP